MKTAIRSLTVVFSIVMLCAFASVPTVYYLRGAEGSLFQINKASFISLLMLLLFLGGLIAIIMLTKVIIVDEEKKVIKIRHPFLLQNRAYRFDEITGFRWSYLSGRVKYKSIKLKAIDRRVYQFSDFEIGNFRVIEKVILKNFDLKYGKDWEPVSENQKQVELQISKAFDIEQAEEIRELLWAALVILTIFSFGVLYKFYENGFSLKLIEIIFFIITLLCLYGSLVKLKSNNQYLKKYKA